MNKAFRDNFFYWLIRPLEIVSQTIFWLDAVFVTIYIGVYKYQNCAGFLDKLFLGVIGFQKK